MLEFLRSDTFLIIIFALYIVLFLMVIISNMRIKRVKKNNEEFMRKLGNGRDISEDLNRYMDRIIDLESGLSETNIHCRQMDKKLQGCIQRVGIVRFSAYKDSGKDLSFAVALLDENNNGVVFNGLYSREMSSIYAKPIVDGKSNYSMTPEESQAILRAMADEGIQRLN